MVEQGAVQITISERDGTRDIEGDEAFPFGTQMIDQIFCQNNPKISKIFGNIKRKYYKTRL